MSDTAEQSHTKTQEEIFVKQLLDEGFIEHTGYLYPNINNFFYDGLDKKTLIECFRVFAKADYSVICSVVTFGEKMCGHKGILHGGASAATLDQFFGIMNCLPPCTGFTGQLNISYKKIILCPSTVLIRGTVDRVERRKHFFKAVIYDEVNDPCVESECLYIESNVKQTFDNAVTKLNN